MRLVSQQVACADSISANIEEGYGRRSRKDYSHFLIISRGSATETRGRYEQRFKHRLPPETIAARVELCDEVIAILSASIRKLRSDE
jgi:four helix bundle protein